ncbi:MAG: LOG family protein, partial [Phycisphaeraceae bacterium]
VITGAGDGIMRAGHGGAGREASFGVAIRLPFETSANEIIAGDPKLITFRYFFTRKLMFMWQAHAVALFPGGFGTHDEGFEALTLIQTGKAPIAPIVMIDREGGSYWSEWDHYVRRQLLATGMISPQDLNLYHLATDPRDAVRHILHFYRNYHSQRFVQDTLVLRMLRPLRDEQVEALNEQFAGLVAEGRIAQGEPFESEREHLELPRLYFTFTRHDYGTLRALIDRINDFDAQNSPATDAEGARVSPPYSDLADQTSPW